MFGIENPYSRVAQVLEEAISACHRAAGETQDIPQAKGRREIEDATYAAKHLLEEALTSARQWQDSFDYHLYGGKHHARTDF